MRAHLKVILSLVFFLSIIFLYIPQVSLAVEIEEKIATNFNELNSFLSDPNGSIVKLGGNIKILRAQAGEDAISIDGGEHILNLNGYTIEYSFVNSANEYDGTPLVLRRGKLTINGPGAIIGGRLAVESGGFGTTVIINGGSYTGRAATALRVQSLLIFNSGNLTGRFGEVWLEGGLMVDNANVVKKINYAHNAGGAIIQNGVLKGNGGVLSSELTLNSLKIDPSSSLTLKEGGIIRAKGLLEGRERIKIVSGYIIQNGETKISQNFTLNNSPSLDKLIIEKDVEVNVADGKTLTLKELDNKARLKIYQGGRLIVNGKVINTGNILFEYPELFKVSGTITNNGSIRLNNNENIINMTNQWIHFAESLNRIGLFKGTGTDAKGQPIYDLTGIPDRQVAITMLVRLLGKETEALSKKWDHPFTDVSEWADPYVGYAYNNGLTKGISSDRFGGRDIISANQYLTFVLRALGYDDSKGDFTWDNPILLAAKIGLAHSDEYNDKTMLLFRGNIATLSFMAVQSDMKDGTPLIKYLVDNGAVKIEDILGTDFEHKYY